MTPPLPPHNISLSVVDGLIWIWCRAPQTGKALGKLLDKRAAVIDAGRVHGCRAEWIEGFGTVVELYDKTYNPDGESVYNTLFRADLS